MGLLKFLAGFDWISPIEGLARGGRPISTHWSSETPAHYEKILGRQGIRIKGRVVTDEGFIIMVDKEDVAKARRILQDAGADIA